MTKVTSENWPKIRKMLTVDGYKNVVIYVESMIEEHHKDIAKLRREFEEIKYAYWALEKKYAAKN